MPDLLDHPLWQPDQLGLPIPASPHAVSVCLPTWRDNVGYEEDDPRVHSQLSTGYPRFVYNKLCRDLFAECRQRFCRDDEQCLAFPSPAAAERFREYFERLTQSPARVHAFGLHDVHAVSFPRVHAAIAKSGWQHCGEGISSRQAEACLTERTVDSGDAAKRTLQSRVAELAGVSAEDVFLYPCGMNAIYRVHRALCRLLPGQKSVQFGFPYVDSLKIQEKFGAGVHFYPRGDADELAQLERALRSEPISGLFTEYPSNPLLASPDLERLSELARRHGFPLIVDETLATWINTDVLPVADVTCTSLTKFFSGVGDVTAGAIVVNPRSPFHGDLTAQLRRDEDIFWCEDAIVLERNSRDFTERLPRINTTAEALADFLHTHPRVAAVEYPKYRTPELYRSHLKEGGGYGGLLSVVVHGAPQNGPRFFDALRVCKGPNLGTNYTLACPYTILAHYRELDFAERCGVSPYLVRVSVGLEEPDDLIERFEQALALAS